MEGEGLKLHERGVLGGRGVEFYQGRGVSESTMETAGAAKD